MDEKDIKIDKDFSEENLKGEVSKPEKKIDAEKLRSNPWILSTFVLGILSLLLILQSFGVLGGSITGKVVSEDLVSNNVDLVMQNVYGLEDFEIKEVQRQEDFYLVSVVSNETTYPFTTTLDGEFVRVPNGIWIRMAELEMAIEQAKNKQQIEDSGFMNGDSRNSSKDSNGSVVV